MFDGEIEDAGGDDEIRPVDGLSINELLRNTTLAMAQQSRMEWQRYGGRPGDRRNLERRGSWSMARLVKPAPPPQGRSPQQIRSDGRWATKPRQDIAYMRAPQDPALGEFPEKRSGARPADWLDDQYPDATYTTVENAVPYRTAAKHARRQQERLDNRRQRQREADHRQALGEERGRNSPPPTF